MKGPRVLLANEPRSYRETMACALEVLRPDAGVLVVEPEALEEEMRRRVPDLVLCSEVTPAVERMARAWIDLYPAGEARVTISVGGLRLTMVEDPGLENLLWILDRIELLSRREGPGGRTGGASSRQPARSSRAR